MNNKLHTIPNKKMINNGHNERKLEKCPKNPHIICEVNNDKKEIKIIDQPNNTANVKHGKLLRQPPGQRKLLPKVPAKPFNCDKPMVKAGGSLVIAEGTLSNKHVKSKIIQPQNLAVQQDVSKENAKYVSNTNKLKVTLMNIKGDKGIKKCDIMSNKNALISENNDKFKKEQTNLLDRNKNKLTVTTRKRVINTDNASKIPDNSLNKCLIKKPIELTSENTERSLKSSLEQESNNNIEPEKLLKLSPYPHLKTDLGLNNLKVSVPLLNYGTQIMHEIEHSNRHNEVLQHNNSRELEKNKNNTKQKDLKPINQPNNKSNFKSNQLIRQPSFHCQRKLLPNVPPKPKKEQPNLLDKNKNKLTVTTKKRVFNTNNTSKIPDNSLNKCLLNEPIELTSENTEKSLMSPIEQESNNNIEPERLLKLAPYPILDTDPTLDIMNLSTPLLKPHLSDYGTQIMHEIEQSNRHNEVLQHNNPRQLEKNKNNSKQKDLKPINQPNKKSNIKSNQLIRQPPGHNQRKLLPNVHPKPKKEQPNLLDKNKNKLTVTTKKRVVNTNNTSKIPDNSLNKCLLNEPIELTSENTEKSLMSPIEQESNNNNIEPEGLLKLSPYPILDTDPTLSIFKLSGPSLGPHLTDYGTQIVHETEHSNRHNEVLQHNNSRQLEKNKNNTMQKDIKPINQPNNKSNFKSNQLIRQPSFHCQRKFLPTVSPKPPNCKKPSGITQKSIKSSIASKKKLISDSIFKEPTKLPYYTTFPVAPQEKKYVQHSAIRSSLFSNVSPYIRFSSYDVKGQPFPLSLQKILKWKLTSVTPAIVRRCIENTGFKLVRSEPIDFDPIALTNYSSQDIKSLQKYCGVTPPVVDLPWKPNSPNNDLPLALPHDWVGTWGRHMDSVNFKRLCDQHKLNHIPGTFQIGRKDRLWVNMQKCIVKYGINEFGFIPTSYILPQDIKKLREVWDKNDKEIKWIIKPPAAARGSGIRVISKWSQIPKKVPLVVQCYIDNPYLINDTKFDLRIYVLITSISPLKLYLYDNGLVRFASVKYSSDFTTISDRYMHLTNYSINRFNTQYTTNEDVNACHGHKWTLKSLWAYLEKERNVDVDKIWKSLMDLVVKTIISGESPISQMCQSYLGNRYNSYELFGIDVLFDEYLKPWILEVNISPSLHSTSELDKAVKGSLIKDLMNVVGYHIPNNIAPSTHSTLLNLLGVGPPLCYDSRMYTLNLLAKEQDKQEYYKKVKSRQEYINSILDDLLPDDVRHLITYEDELTQLGSFQKVFPTTSTFKYLQYFDGPRYYNMLLDAWEHKYSEKRDEGIAVLEELCQSMVHLDVPEDSDVE